MLHVSALLPWLANDNNSIPASLRDQWHNSVSLLVSHTDVTSHKWDAQSLDAVEGSYYRATASVTTSKVTSEVVFSYSYAMATFDVVWINPLWDLFTVLPNSRDDDIKAGLDRAIPPLQWTLWKQSSPCILARPFLILCSQVGVGSLESSTHGWRPTFTRGQGVLRWLGWPCRFFELRGSGFGSAARNGLCPVQSGWRLCTPLLIQVGC